MSDTELKITDILALGRTRMAAERTLMAWVRTALSMISLGVFYRITDWLLLWGGYRGLYTNYDKNGFKFDAWIHGLYLGVGFEF